MNEDERFTPLEQSMAAMRPKAMPADLMAELVDEMARDDRRQRWGDRLLLTAIGSGVAAACVIVSMLLLQATADAPSASHSPILATGQLQRTGDILAFFPRNDGTIIK